MAGIDANPDVVAVTVVLPDGNYKVSRCFSCPDLVHASREKRQWIAGNLAQEVATWVKGLGVTQVALEDVSFAQDHYAEGYALSAHQAAALVIARRALGFGEKVPQGLAQMLAPKEGCRHWQMWGKLFGLFKAARKRARQEDRLFRRWSACDWVGYMLAGSG